MLRRQLWLIVTVAALLGAEAPLCILACVEDNPTADIAAHQTEAPCHGSASNSPPSGSPDAREDCACKFEYEALVASSSDPTAESSGAGMAFIPQSVLPDRIGSVLRGVAIGYDLPRPDILLMKSTLII